MKKLMTRLKNSGFDLLPVAIGFYLLVCTAIVIYLLVRFYELQ